jgi:hypothetical protein
MTVGEKARHGAAQMPFAKKGWMMKWEERRNVLRERTATRFRRVLSGVLGGAYRRGIRDPR